MGDIEDIVDCNTLDISYSPKFIILLGEGSFTNECIARDIAEDLLEEHEKFLETNRVLLWNRERYFNIRCVIIDNCCIPSDRLKMVSRIIRNPLNVEWVIITLNMLDSQLFRIIEYFPHWCFIIYSDLTDREYFLYIKSISERIREKDFGETDQWFPTYSLHSSRWLSLKERGRRLLKDTDRKLYTNSSIN